MDFEEEIKIEYDSEDGFDTGDEFRPPQPAADPLADLYDQDTTPNGSPTPHCLRVADFCRVGLPDVNDPFQREVILPDDEELSDQDDPLDSCQDDPLQFNQDDPELAVDEPIDDALPVASLQITTRSDVPKDKRNSESEQSALNVECDFCSQKFRYKSHLADHVKVHFKCDICNKKHNTHSYLMTHLKTHKRATFTCLYCKERFGNWARLKSHTFHHGFKCTQCPHVCPSKTALSTHVSDVHGTKNQCWTCKMTFVKESLLRRHVRSCQRDALVREREKLKSDEKVGSDIKENSKGKGRNVTREKKRLVRAKPKDVIPSTVKTLKSKKGSISAKTICNDVDNSSKEPGGKVSRKKKQPVCEKSKDVIPSPSKACQVKGGSISMEPICNDDEESSKEPEGKVIREKRKRVRSKKGTNITTPTPNPKECAVKDDNIAAAIEACVIHDAVDSLESNLPGPSQIPAQTETATIESVEADSSVIADVIPAQIAESDLADTEMGVSESLFDSISMSGEESDYFSDHCSIDSDTDMNFIPHFGREKLPKVKKPKKKVRRKKPRIRVSSLNPQQLQEREANIARLIESVATGKRISMFINPLKSTVPPVFIDLTETPDFPTEAESASVQSVEKDNDHQNVPVNPSNITESHLDSENATVIKSTSAECSEAVEKEGKEQNIIDEEATANSLDIPEDSLENGADSKPDVADYESDQDFPDHCSMQSYDSDTDVNVKQPIEMLKVSISPPVGSEENPIDVGKSRKRKRESSPGPDIKLEVKSLDVIGGQEDTTDESSKVICTKNIKKESKDISHSANASSNIPKARNMKKNVISKAGRVKDKNSPLVSKRLKKKNSRSRKRDESNSEYICDTCKKSYPTKVQIVTHFYTCHRYNIFCNDCDRTFRFKRPLILHIAKCHSPTSATFCSICNTQFDNHELLTSHMTTHKVECPVCFKLYPSQKSLKKHLHIHSSTNERFQCDVCPKSFSCNRNLKAHKVYHLARFQCHLCDKAYGGRRNYNEHMATHTTEKPFECDICKKRYATLRRLKNHIWCHDKSTLCNLCGMRLPSGFSKLKLHIKKKHTLKEEDSQRALLLGTFECDVCHKKFIEQKRLDMHYVVHTGKYKCPICDRCVGTKDVLQKHIKRHAAVKLQCTACPKTFCSDVALQRHVAVHLTGKFTCASCGLTLGSRHQLAVHRKEHRVAKKAQTGPRKRKKRKKVPQSHIIEEEVHEDLERRVIFINL